MNFSRLQYWSSYNHRNILCAFLTNYLIFFWNKILIYFLIDALSFVILFFLLICSTKTLKFPPLLYVFKEELHFREILLESYSMILTSICQKMFHCFIAFQFNAILKNVLHLIVLICKVLMNQFMVLLFVLKYNLLFKLWKSVRKDYYLKIMFRFLNQIPTP